jgi:predicted ABC-type transport system involved in lysophospholipase L1 biosynthesis ATPase subunit
MPEPVVSLRAVTKSVREGRSQRTILDGVDLEVRRGETVAIVGRSGSGKSTLLHLIAGLDRADSGSIALCGRDLGALDEKARAELRREQVGFVFQAFHLLPTLTALENVLLPLELARRDRSSSERRARALLDAVGLADRADSFPAVLSGGEQQRIAVARALATEPVLVLADEPTGNLDDESAETVLSLLSQLIASQNGSLVVVTHALSVAARCDRSLRLEHGALREGSGAERA